MGEMWWGERDVTRKRKRMKEKKNREREKREEQQEREKGGRGGSWVGRREKERASEQKWSGCVLGFAQLAAIIVVVPNQCSYLDLNVVSRYWFVHFWHRRKRSVSLTPVHTAATLHSRIASFTRVYTRAVSLRHS